MRFVCRVANLRLNRWNCLLYETSEKHGNCDVMVDHYIGHAIPISIREEEIGPSAHGIDIEEMHKETLRIRCQLSIEGLVGIQPDDRQEDAAPEDIFASSCHNGLLPAPLLVRLFVGCDGMDGIEDDEQNDRQIVVFPFVHDVGDKQSERQPKGEGDAQVAEERVNHVVSNSGESLCVVLLTERESAVGALAYRNRPKESKSGSRRISSSNFKVDAVQRQLVEYSYATAHKSQALGRNMGRSREIGKIGRSTGQELGNVFRPSTRSFDAHPNAASGRNQGLFY